MSTIKPRLTLHAEHTVIRSDVPSIFDIVVELVSSTPEESAPSGRKPLNLCLCIDRSGSMEGDKLVTAKRCATEITKRLTDDTDTLSIVVFDDVAEVIFNPTSPREHLSELIASVQARGQTDLASGWRLSLLELQTHGNDRQVHRVILLSDGQANAGETKRDILERDSARAYQLGITTSTIGIGKDFQEDILQSIASASSGNFWFVEESSLESIIKAEFEGALSILYEHPKIRIELPDGVSIERSLNTLSKSGRSEYRLPPVWAGKRIAYAWRLEADPTSALTRGEPFLVTCTLFDQGVHVAQSSVEIALGTQQEYAATPANGVVIEEVQKYLMGASDEKALSLLDEGDIEGVRDLIIEMRAGMRVARSKMAAEASEEAAARERMDEEDRMMRVLEQVLLLVQELGQGLGPEVDRRVRESVQSGAFRKLFRHRHHAHHERKWTHLHDRHMHGLVEAELLHALSAVVSNLLSQSPTDKDLQVLMERLNERMARFSGE